MLAYLKFVFAPAGLSVLALSGLGLIFYFTGFSLFAFLLTTPFLVGLTSALIVSIGLLLSLKLLFNTVYCQPPAFKLKYIMPTLVAVLSIAAAVTLFVLNLFLPLLIFASLVGSLLLVVSLCSNFIFRTLFEKAIIAAMADTTRHIEGKRKKLRA